MIEQKQKQRMEWLDAMRGFTMLMVVAYHVSLISFGEAPKTSAAMSLLIMFRMPLFFFVSGFLAYRASFQWGLVDTLRLVLKKIHIQLLPTFIFLCAFLVIRRADFCESFVDAMKSPYKGGYWFTLVLLYMFILYYFVAFITKRLKHQHWVFIVFWLLSIAVYETAYMPKYFKYPNEFFWKASSFIQLILYFQFFLFGNVVHRYWNKVLRIFDSQWFYPVLCVVAFGCCAEYLRWHSLRGMWINLPRTTAMYATLLVVLMFFRHYHESFTHETRIGRWLQYVGTRTLDVYLLHYIFLPKIPFMGEWFNANRPNFVMSVFCSVCVAIIVICFCLLVSNILRVSPLYSKHLFGRPVPKVPMKNCEL